MPFELAHRCKKTLAMARLIFYALVYLETYGILTRLLKLYFALVI